MVFAMAHLSGPTRHLNSVNYSCRLDLQLQGLSAAFHQAQALSVRDMV